MSDIWSPIQVGAMRLPNRMVMAPMTRGRALPDGTPSEISVEYYAQRASLGLLVTEGTQPSEDGQGYMNTPGIHNDAQAEGWRRISTAVHRAGGHLFIQLMHVGRMSHPDNTPHHRQPVAPSAVAPGLDIFTAAGPLPIPEPRALTREEIAATVQDFADAARRAVEAGADGVEIHGANGYLIQQFIAPNANRREDEYGGTIPNRYRFAVEVARAVAGAIGPERTAIRLSPAMTLGGLDEGPEGPELYRQLVAELDKIGLAYLHLVHIGNETLLADLRKAWNSALILNRAGLGRERVGQDVVAGVADLESYGQMALANPDLMQRIRVGAPLNEPRKEFFYGGGAAGYTDYPTLSGAEAVAA
ncbi:alkene reductase [Sphingomonas sp. DT-207]|uniref:alkene reductase n=1 Tax=Sphingomonas sp. DT-207 TaxID=3396167 RepID=UPI003F1E4367